MSAKKLITKTKDRKLSAYIGADKLRDHIQIIEETAFLKTGYRVRTWQNDSVIVSRDELLKICKVAGIAVVSEAAS
jgi:hypothetical protein